MIDRVVTVGEALAVFRTSPGQPLWRAEQVAVGTGGAEANVAMTLAHRGVPVTWAGRVGDDSLGRRVTRELQAEGVTVSAVRDVARPTGLLVKDVRGDGRTVVSYYRSDSAGSALSVTDVDHLALDLGPGVLLHLTGITSALSPTAAEAVQHLVSTARGRGATISFDVNHRPRLWGDRSADASHRALAAAADVLFASVDEVPFLVDGAPSVEPAASGGCDRAARAAAVLAAHGHRHVVVTDGSAGSAVSHDGVVASSPALDVAVVDTVGAGDAFVGGYLAAWSRGEDLPGRLVAGSVSGAAACRHGGDWEGAVDLGGLPPRGGEGLDPVVR